MKNRKYSSQLFPFENSDSYTQNASRINNQNNGKETLTSREKTEIYQSINRINGRLDELENENKRLQKDLNETRTRENKLLNRFSWLILILNWGSVILIIIFIILFINSIYPFIKNLIDSDVGIRVSISIIGGAIATGIIGIWLSFNKYVDKVIEREKKQ